MAGQPAPPLEEFSAETQAGVASLDTNLLEAACGATVYAGLATGTAAALVLTIPLALPDYYYGMTLSFLAAVNNTAAPTVQVVADGQTLAAISLTDTGGVALGANVVVAGLMYSGVVVQTGPSTAALRLNGAGISAPVSSVFGRTGAVVAASGDYAIGQITGAGTLASQAASAVAITGGAMSGVTLTGNTGPQVPKAWVFSDGSGTVQANYQAPTVTRVGTGHYTVTLAANAVPDATCAVVPSCGGSSAPYSINFDQSSFAYTAGVFSFDLFVRNANTALTDQYFTAFVYHA